MNGSDHERMRCLVHVLDKLLEAYEAARPFAQDAQPAVVDAANIVRGMIEETGAR